MSTQIVKPIVKVPKKIGSKRFCDEHDNMDYLGILLHSLGISKKKLKKTKSYSNVMISYKHPNTEPGWSEKYTVYHLLKLHFNIIDKEFPHKMINYNDEEKDLKKRREYFINFLRRNNIEFTE